MMGQTLQSTPLQKVGGLVGNYRDITSFEMSRGNQISDYSSLGGGGAVVGGGGGGGGGSGG